MKTLEERAKSIADWILRRASQLKVYNLPKMFEDMLNEQKEIDIDKAIKAHCKVCMAYNACTERGSFVCPQTDRIKKTMDE